MQSTETRGSGLHESHEVIFVAEPNKVMVNGGPAHGSWSLETPKKLLHVIWNWKSDEKSMKKHIFARIPDTYSWLQINGPPEWRNVLVPASGAARGFDVDMTDA
jgi:hypothetical protein